MLEWINREHNKENPQRKVMLANERSDHAKAVLVSDVKGDHQLQERIRNLEEQLKFVENKLEKITKSNENTQKDMRFFETMLLEEYHLLLQLLGKDNNIQIHQSE